MSVSKWKKNQRNYIAILHSVVNHTLAVLINNHLFFLQNNIHPTYTQIKWSVLIWEKERERRKPPHTQNTIHIYSHSSLRVCVDDHKAKKKYKAGKQTEYVRRKKQKALWEHHKQIIIILCSIWDSLTMPTRHRQRRRKKYTAVFKVIRSY